MLDQLCSKENVLSSLEPISCNWAHALINKIWLVFTRISGFFSTKLIYCKNIKDKYAQSVKYICITNYDKSHT